MKLLSDEILEQLPRTGSTWACTDRVLYVKLFEPSWERYWYVAEFDGKDFLFGLIECKEAGLSWMFFILSDLEEECEPDQGRVERDYAFKPTLASTIIKGRPVDPYPGCLTP